MSTSTDSPSTTNTCKEEQKPPAVCTPETNAGTTTVTKADFENFKREILTISTQNSERFQPPTQSMPGKYSKKKRNFSETIMFNLTYIFLRSYRFYHFVPEKYSLSVQQIPVS